MSSSRQLAAIMFTDIVGYTALMGQDEQKAFNLLDKNRQVQKPIIEQYNGRWIKELGDGVMASFHTVSDAVNAAIKIQQACNAAKDFQLRIGIHLGEVVFENDDVFGDGVNIASRIQAIANPGSIYISEAVYNSISNKKDFQTSLVKAEKLKNVKEPVKIYQVIADNVVTVHPGVTQKIKSKRTVILLLLSILIILVATYIFKGGVNKNVQAPAAVIPTMNSIAVLPFVNTSGDSAREYFSDGITEAIITELGQIPGLLVIARNSVFQYKGKVVTPAEIGKLLNVRYMLQGKIHHAGDDIRISTQLIETENGTEKWAKNFDSKLKNIFLLQDTISRTIIHSLKIAIAREEQFNVKRPTENLEAYEYYLQGHYLFRKAAANDRKLIDSAIVLFEKAVSLDPRFALAHAALAKAYNTIFFIYDPDLKWDSKAYVAVEKAMSLDPGLAFAFAVKADIAWNLSRGFPHEQAIKDLRHAIDLNPNLVEAHESLGSIYFHIGLFDKALSELRTAVRLDPAGNFSKPRIARIYWYQQKFDSAMAQFTSIPDLGGSLLREKALVAWYLGDTAEAFRILDPVQEKVTPGMEFQIAAGYAVLYAGIGKKKEAEEKIRLTIERGAGTSHFHHAEHLIASAYALMGDTKAAVEWLQKTADHGLPCYPLFKNDPNLKSLKNDPGYISLMEKLKAQWEIYKSIL